LSPVERQRFVGGLVTGFVVGLVGTFGFLYLRHRSKAK
jgi:hypothetical protein